MTDKRLAEIIDDICHSRPVKMTNEEGKQFVKAYHVSQRKELNKWQVKGAGSEKAIKLFDTQK